MRISRPQVYYLLTILFSVLFLCWGASVSIPGANLFRNEAEIVSIPCQVTEITLDKTDMGELGAGSGNYYLERTLVFDGVVLSGEQKGQTIQAVQIIDNLSGAAVYPVEPGDKIFLYPLQEPSHGAMWQAGDYYRSPALGWLGALFLAGLILFGRKKGVNTILSLVFTCLAIFVVFVPAILSGYNPYLVSLGICGFVIAMTLSLVSGFTLKSLASALGCAGGVLTAGLLTLLCTHLLKLTGMVDDTSVYVSLLNEDHPIDMLGILFAANIIGAMGATMDVAMSISSSLHELKEKAPGLGFGQLFASGVNIGRDIMGTMSNTLILAYIGSSLSTVLLFASYQSSLMQLLNREAIVIEILQALTGSIGILCTIPISACIASLLYRPLSAPAPAPEPATKE